MNESRKMEGATCDRRGLALHGRSSSIKEVVGFMDWIKPTYSEEAWPDETRAEERNINYFTCLVSTVDIRGALLKSDV